jgi:hypothetical protein
LIAYIQRLGRDIQAAGAPTNASAPAPAPNVIHGPTAHATSPGGRAP